MKIGIVSDTHNNLKNVAKIVELFNDAGVDTVVHTGDITQAKTLELFGQLKAPLSGVFGNNDQERESLEETAEKFGFRFVDPPLFLELARKQIIVVHDPSLLPSAAMKENDVVLHGHTHLLRMESIDSALVFNPGECAGHMEGMNAVGVLDLGTMQPELLKF